MSDATPRPIPGTEGGPENPVFSPDGQFIAFFTRTAQGGSTPGGLPQGLIKRVRLTGGTPVTLCETAYPLGMSWGVDGLVFGQAAKGVMRVSADGGEPELLVPVNEDELALGPQVLPGGRAVLFTHASDLTNLMRPQESFDRFSIDAWNKARVVVESLQTRERTALIEGGSDGRYDPTGHIV